MLGADIRHAIENGQDPNNPFSYSRDAAYDAAMEDFRSCGLSFEVAREILRRQAAAARDKAIHKAAWYAQQNEEKVRVVVQVGCMVFNFCGPSGNSVVDFAVLRKAVA